MSGNSFNPGDLAYVLDEVYEIAVRAGLHCSPCAHKVIGTLETGTLRVSMGYFNSRQEIDLLIAALGDMLVK